MSQAPIPRVGFLKPWKSCAEQVGILASRGLQIADPVAAEKFLSHINYYRFSGYCLAFERSRHVFEPGVTFEHIRQAYVFDWTLRDLISDALEVVEIDIRATIAQHFGHKYGPFGHANAVNFFHRFNHPEWIEKLHEESMRSSELFVVHFRRTYLEFPDLPIWMSTEIMSLGALSKRANGMFKDDLKVVGRKYNLQPQDFPDWIHHLVYVRNLCAHHARIWDRTWAIKPTLPAAFAWQPPKLPGNNRLFVTLLILSSMLKRCPSMTDFRAGWRKRIEEHIKNPPAAPDALGKMGLTANWFAHPFWL
ncbi:MAG TPA: Abi family protein [Humisphaera sp.]|nr:Abi family protein [Humisphaera sp.]